MLTLGAISMHAEAVHMTLIRGWFDPPDRPVRRTGVLLLAHLVKLAGLLVRMGRFWQRSRLPQNSAQWAVAASRLRSCSTMPYGNPLRATLQCYYYPIALISLQTRSCRMV